MNSGSVSSSHCPEHRTTKVRSPRTNGFVELMNRTLLLSASAS